jgi:hypothetical protein
MVKDDYKRNSIVANQSDMDEWIGHVQKRIPVDTAG